MPPSSSPRRDVPIVLVTRALLSFATTSRAAALVLPDLGFAAFFIAGISAAVPGAPWMVLLAVVLGLLCRAIDIESWTLFVPGGPVGRVERAFGPRGALAASAATLLERLLLAALGCAAAGQYVASFLFAASRSVRVQRAATAGDIASMVALCLLAYLWLRARRGTLLHLTQRVQRLWAAVGLIFLVTIWATVTAALHGGWQLLHLNGLPARVPADPRSMAALAVILLAGFAHVTPAIGSGDSLWRVASELEPPRIRGLRRTALIVAVYGIGITAATAFALPGVLPEEARRSWLDAPLLGMARFLGAPGWIRGGLATLVTAAAVFMLGQAARAGLTGAESIVSRLAARGVLANGFKTQHPRFGTLARTLDTLACIAAGIVLLSGAQIGWLAGAYGVALAWTVGLHTAALIRLQARHPESPFRPPLTLRLGKRTFPGGLWLVTLVLAASQAAVLVTRDPAALAAMATLIVLGLVMVASAKPELATTAPGDVDTSQLSASGELSLEQLTPSPGSLLVPVRNPHSLLHLAAALRAPRDRTVFVMTARLQGIDAEAETLEQPAPTEAEQLLFSRVLAMAERYARPVRLLIVPGHDVFDAIVTAALRLQASEIYVGESVTISAEAQARQLGEAWERRQQGTGQQDVQLAVHHPSGRADVFHLGPHAPALTPRDFDLIHTIWLDAARTLGPHIHHHDVVRAALTQMADQLNGPDRVEALQAITRVSKPADELAAALHARDYSQLRDIVRNRPPGDLAELLATLDLADQAVVFRLLPRRDAAMTFEYLEQDAREALLKTLSKEDVASLLNNMSPDDRTMFLEELPATVTRELLQLLTPQERAIAVTLLGYPERSVGRLMTPDYVAVHEDWTVQQVLDYVRTHGQDSETLNVIYVVDAHGGLIDDIRIREFLLTDPVRKVSDLMDRRFVALKASDDQQAAVAEFRQYDRSALPVTDTAGVLIGIVTVDDVLDVAETEATRDIQRIGGSEALNEPYMEIRFAKMVEKRAGWLTALFFGEMLTATAMGFFEDEISKAVVLTLFLPLIISSGGNSGSQASTLVIRALALGEVSLRDWWRVMRREIGAGFALGTILAIVGFMRITVWSMFSTIYGPHWLLVAFTVAFALVGVVLWGTLIGRLAAAAAAPSRLRSGHLIGALRRDAGRRDRADYLFLRSPGGAPRDPASVTLLFLPEG